MLLPFRVLRASLVLAVSAHPLYPAHGPRSPPWLIPMIAQESPASSPVPWCPSLEPIKKQKENNDQKSCLAITEKNKN